MKPTNYSHEQEAPSEAAQMYERLRSFTAGAEGMQRGLLVDYPDLHSWPAVQMQPASAAEPQPNQPTQAAHHQAEQMMSEQPFTGNFSAAAPRTATPGLFAVARTEQEQYEMDRQQRETAALERANREAS